MLQTFELGIMSSSMTKCLSTFQCCLACCWRATLICAIRSPHTNLLTLYTILDIYFHNTKLHEILYYCGCYMDEKKYSYSRKCL